MIGFVKGMCRTLGLVAALGFGWSAGTVEAQRTVGTTAGTLAVDEAKEGLDRASCVVMLRVGPRGSSGSFAAADLTAMTTAMTTTGLIDPSVKAALGLGPREWSKVVRIEVTPAGTQAVKLSVAVDPGPKGLKTAEPASSLLHELIARAKTVLTQSAEPRRHEAKDRLEELEAHRNELRASIEVARKKVRDAEALGTRGNTFDYPGNTRRQLETELAAKRPRLQAIRDLETLLATTEDPLGAAFKGLVAAREGLVAGLEKAVEQGKAEPLELLKARAELAETRVRAAESARLVAAQSGRNLAGERLALEVDIASSEAQLKAMPEKKDEPARPSIEEIQALRNEMHRLENERTNLDTQYFQAKREFDQLGSPPSLVVLDGQAN